MPAAARHGMAFTKNETLTHETRSLRRITHHWMRHWNVVTASQEFSKAYLRHLIMAKDPCGRASQFTQFVFS